METALIRLSFCALSGSFQRAEDAGRQRHEGEVMRELGWTSSVGLLSVVLLGGLVCASVLLGSRGPTGAVSTWTHGTPGPDGWAPHPVARPASARYAVVAPHVGDARLCLDVPEGSTVPGKQLRLDDCHASAADSRMQRWEL